MSSQPALGHGSSTLAQLRYRKHQRRGHQTQPGDSHLEQQLHRLIEAA